ncbi:MAG: MmgE/PrpD family protein [Thermodesulfobacteriota bacterium]
MSDIKAYPTELLGRYVKELKYESLPAAVVAYAKLLVLDYLASAVAGYKVNKIFNQAVLDVVGGMGGRPESTVLFGGGRLPAANAAFLNAAFGHGADLDDGHRTAQGHPGVATIPAVLALAEATGKTGKDAIAAIVAGYEVYVRLSNAVMPSHFQRGFHGTGTVGAVAAGAAAAKTLNLSEEEVRRAISLAAVQASGLFEVSESGQMTKPINPGNAVRTGVISALLARAGCDAPTAPLEGAKGFIKAFTDTVDWDALTKELGKRHLLTTCYIKLYPGCRHLHGAIDCAVKHHKSGSIPSVDAVDRIRIYAYPAAIQVVGNILEPTSEDGAKFSMTYAAATALISGNYTLEDLSAARSMSAKVRATIRKIEIVGEPALENRAAGIRGTRMELVLKDGTVKTESVILPKGDPEVPLEDGDMREKLRSCATGVYGETVQEALYEKAMQLDTLSDVGELVKILT